MVKGIRSNHCWVLTIGYPTDTAPEIELLRNFKLSLRPQQLDLELQLQITRMVHDSLLQGQGVLGRALAKPIRFL